MNSLRELYNKQINYFKESSDIKFRGKFYNAYIFAKLIDDCFETIRSTGLKKIFNTKDGDISYSSQCIGDSLMFNLIFFVYSLLEIIDESYLQKHELYILRSKFGHGKEFAPMNIASRKPQKFLVGKEITFLFGSSYDFNENYYYFSGIWQARMENGMLRNFIDGETFNDSIKAREKLLNMLGNKETFIDSSANFVVNITKLYEMVYMKSEEFIKKIVN